MYIKRLAENLVQKALLLFEILSFEVYGISDSDSPTQRYGESATLRIKDTRSRRLPVSLSQGVVFQIRISLRIAVGYYAKKIKAVSPTTLKNFKRCRLVR
jgi:hypothetical protein